MSYITERQSKRVGQSAAAVEKDGVSGEHEKKFAERRFENRFAIEKQ